MVFLQNAAGVFSLPPDINKRQDKHYALTKKKNTHKGVKNRNLSSHKKL